MEQRHILSPRDVTPGTPDGLSAESIRARLAGRAPRRLDAPLRGDANTALDLARVLGTEPLPAVEDKPTVPAAVLVPLVAREAGLHVLLTKRTDHLDHHPGQISFPGGRMEPGDADETAGALREAREEIGLDPARVEILGRLEDYLTITGFRVAPVVGLLHPPFAFALDPFEVAELFEVPLTFILDRANHQRHFREAPDGQRRYFYAIPYQSHYIWGATAAMLVDLSNVLALSGTAASRPK